MKYRGTARSKCNLTFSVPKELSIAIHSGSKCDYYFIMKELAENSLLV